MEYQSLVPGGRDETSFRLGDLSGSPARDARSLTEPAVTAKCWMRRLAFKMLRYPVCPHGQTALPSYRGVSSLAVHRLQQGIGIRADIAAAHVVTHDHDGHD